jgi:hypothetical protein
VPGRWLPVFEAEAQRRGILSGPLPLSQLIGGASTSGGTHLTGGADDTYPLTGIDVERYVWLSRQMGADATWLRPFDWDGHGGVAHVHRVLTGCPHNQAARYQIVKVRAGLNGLANDLGDDGPRPLSGRTWQEGLAWAREQEDIVTDRCGVAGRPDRRAEEGGRDGQGDLAPQRDHAHPERRPLMTGLPWLVSVTYPSHFRLIIHLLRPPR